jgi:hypothetical protein
MTIDLRSAVVMRRVPIFPWGEVHHRAAPGGVFDVTPEFAATLVASYEAITADGYRAPIMREHTADGTTRGVVLRAYTIEGAEYAVYADIAWRADIYAGIEAGEFAYISPSIHFEGQHPHTGQVLPLLLREISLVSVPHLKGLPPLSDHYDFKDMPTLGHFLALSEEGYLTTCSDQESSMSTTPPEPTGNETTEETPLDAASILQAIEGLAMRVDNLQANLQTTPEGAPPVDNTEDASLRDELAEIKGKLALAEARATYAAQMPGADDDAITAVAALSLSNPEQADQIVKMHATAPTPPTPIVGAQGTPTGSLTVPQAFAAAEKKLGAAASFSEVWAEVKTQIPSATIGDLD